MTSGCVFRDKHPRKISQLVTVATANMDGTVDGVIRLIRVDLSPVTPLDG